MDQGFNDDELADIMNEIESLEQEFQEETQDEIEAKSDQGGEAQSHQDESQPESEVVEQLAQKSGDEIDQAQKQAHDDQNVHSFKPASKQQNSGGWQNSAVEFSVEGDMKMNMTFKVSGKQVHLHINDSAFEIELEGGMKFSIPVHPESSKKAA